MRLPDEVLPDDRPATVAGDGAVVSFDEALAAIATSAHERDAAPEPAFPVDAFALLQAAGVMQWNAHPGAHRPPAAAELLLVRRVAAADGSVGRIFDGHLNGVERLAVHAPAELRESELQKVSAGRLKAGVWGGEPIPGEGPPAAVVDTGQGEVLRGVKTFCSGAGGLDRALVLGRAAEPGPPLAVWIDVTDTDRVEVDTGWYRSFGLRASVSHRVLFHDAPVLARFGPPGAIAEQPWFGRDALRTAASWAGMADSAAAGAFAELAARPDPGLLEQLAAGRIATAQRTITVWLEAAARAMDEAREELALMSVQARVAIAAACRDLLEEAARACGPRPFATGSRLDRARRDLEVFLLQHRLDPLLARAGARLLSEQGT